MANYGVWLNLTPFSSYSTQFLSSLLPFQSILTCRKVFQCLTEEFKTLMYLSGPATLRHVPVTLVGSLFWFSTHQSLHFSPWPLAVVFLHLSSPSFPLYSFDVYPSLWPWSCSPSPRWKCFLSFGSTNLFPSLKCFGTCCLCLPPIW